MTRQDQRPTVAFVLSLISGLLILLGGLFGTLILIFSIVAMFGGAMGGFGLGSILGIVGGILALTWKPSS